MYNTKSNILRQIYNESFVDGERRIKPKTSDLKGLRQKIYNACYNEVMKIYNNDPDALYDTWGLCTKNFFIPGFNEQEYKDIVAPYISVLTVGINGDGEHWGTRVHGATPEREQIEQALKKTFEMQEHIKLSKFQIKYGRDGLSIQVIPLDHPSNRPPVIYHMKYNKHSK